MSGYCRRYPLKDLRGIMPHLIICYGPPGVGKTSVCNELSQWGIYANCGASPLFRKIPMAEIAASIFSKRNADLYITEGVMQKRMSRLNLIRQIQDKMTDSFKIADVYTIFLVASPQVLAKRRNRTVEEYESIIRNFEIGNDPYKNFVVEVNDKSSPGLIAKTIISLVAPRLVSACSV